MRLVQPRFGSTLATPERLTSKLEPLRCLRLRHRTAGTAGLRRHGAIGMRRGCETADGQPSHVISSCLQVQHAAHAIGV